jgi:CubicO group peptidase (beta-lactamase class C family)
MGAMRVASLLTAVALAGCSSSSAPSESPVEDACAALPAGKLGSAGLSEALEEALTLGFDGARAPGLVVHVVVPGQGSWFGARGVADVPSDEPLSTAARFRVGSITKTFTSAAVLQLVEEGAWTLDDPVDDYVPGWDFGPEVTLERLLNHTSGIYNYTDDPGFLVDTQRDVEPEEVVDFALAHGDLFPPGTAYTYSNTGYYLLGLALESVEGKPFEQVIRDRLIAPRDLSSLYLEQYEAGACPPTQGHVGFGTPITEGFSMTWAWAAGGLVGDVTDLCRWADALVMGDVLEPGTLAQMMTESEHSAEPNRYALGLAFEERGGRLAVGHTGSTMGFNGELFIDPNSGLCIAAQTNDFFGEPSAVAVPLWEALAGAGY